MNKKIFTVLAAACIGGVCNFSTVDAHGVFFANRVDEKVLFRSRSSFWGKALSIMPMIRLW